MNPNSNNVILYWGNVTFQSQPWLSVSVPLWATVKVYKFRCCHRLKYALIHPPILSACSPVCLCGSLTSYVKLPWRLSGETKTLKSVKYPAKECLTIKPFISILNINEFPRGSFPRSPSHLSLISLSPSPLLKPQPNTKPSVLFRDSATHLAGFQVVCVCLRHLCFCHLLKCKCACKTWKPQKNLFAAPHYEVDYFQSQGPANKRVSACVLCTLNCCPAVAAERRAPLRVVVVVSALSFFLMGIHAVLPLVKHQRLIRNTNKAVWVWMQTHTDTHKHTHTLSPLSHLPASCKQKQKQKLDCCK